jgi:hypothetical protein
VYKSDDEDDKASQYVIANIGLYTSCCFSLFFKAYLAVMNQMEQKRIPGVQKLPQRYQSAPSGFHSKTPKSSQYFQVVN